MAKKKTTPTAKVTKAEPVTKTVEEVKEIFEDTTEVSLENPLGGTAGGEAGYKEAPASLTEPPAPPSNKVEVDKDVLQDILSQLSELKQSQQQYEDSASQDQIMKIERMRASGKLVKSVKLRRIEEKVVLGWKMVIDEVYFANDRVHEKQVYAVLFEDGTKR